MLHTEEDLIFHKAEYVYSILNHNLNFEWNLIAQF